MPWIKTNLCTGCGECVLECPTGSWSLSSQHVAVHDASSCSHCAQCVRVCPEGAIQAGRAPFFVPRRPKPKIHLSA